jgi:hypothetical protein
MDLSLVADNLLNPPILFFVMGLLAVWFRSDLEIPQPLPKLFSLYLLFSIGYEGGVRLGASGFSPYVLLCIGLALFMATLVPVYSYFILRAKLDVPNAAAIAATYGSISAVTFLTAVAFLGKIGLPYGGHMVAGMALMESPAIVVGVLLARRFGAASTSPERTLNWKHLLREAVANASVFMLLGSLIIGVLTGEKAAPSMEPFTHHIFKGMLSFFLLDIGLVAARKMGDLKKSGPFLIGFGSGYTIIRDVQGKGGRGLRSNDTVTDVFKNIYLLGLPARGSAKHYGVLDLLDAGCAGQLGSA